jgi:small subunit ribosomal protein S9
MAIRKTKKKKVVKKVVKKVKSNAILASNKTSDKKIILPKGECVEMIGRRKTSVARVKLFSSAGDIIVNDKLASKYFTNILNATYYLNQPFVLTSTTGKYALKIKTFGGGIHSQLEASVLGIVRALVKSNPEFKSLFKEKGMMTRDSRMKETRKPGRGGKARRKRQSPRR